MAPPTDVTTNIRGTSATFFQIGIGGTRINSRGTGSPPAVASAGDLYFDQTTNLLYFYDAVRSKWLSVERIPVYFGRNGNTGGGGVFYRGIDREVLSATKGQAAIYDGTVVSIAYTRADVSNATIEVTANGTTIASLFSAQNSDQQDNLDGDFSQGDILAARNAGPTNTNDVQAVFYIRWRL